MPKALLPSLSNLNNACLGQEVFSNEELLAQILQGLCTQKQQNDFCSFASSVREAHATASTNKEFAAAVNLLKGPTEEDAMEFLETIGITLPSNIPDDSTKVVPWGYDNFRTCAADVCLTLSNLRLGEVSCSDRAIETMKAKGLTSLNIKAGRNRHVFTTNEHLKDAILNLQASYNYWIDPDYGPICAWDVSRMTDLSEVFSLLDDFNQPLNRWNVSNVRNMNRMFCWAENFNQPLDKWNVSNVENMQQMFAFANSFNQPLNRWNVSNVRNMNRMFCFARNFNQPLDQWGPNLSKVTDMAYLFDHAVLFDQPLETWDVSNVETMRNMFSGARSFNQPLDKWGPNLSKVTDMSYLFDHAVLFDQPLETWDVSNVTNMRFMFHEAQSYNQVFTRWNLASLQVYTFFALNSSITHDAVEKFVDAAEQKGTVVA